MDPLCCRCFSGHSSSFPFPTPVRTHHTHSAAQAEQPHSAKIHFRALGFWQRFRYELTSCSGDLWFWAAMSVKDASFSKSLIISTHCCHTALPWYFGPTHVQPEPAQSWLQPHEQTVENCVLTLPVISWFGHSRADHTQHTEAKPNIGRGGAANQG